MNAPIRDYKSLLGEYEKIENESADRAKIREAVNIGITLDEVTYYANEVAHAIVWSALNQAMAEGDVVKAGTIICNIYQSLSDEGVSSRIADPDRISMLDLKRAAVISQMGVKA